MTKATIDPEREAAEAEEDDLGYPQGLTQKDIDEILEDAD